MMIASQSIPTLEPTSQRASRPYDRLGAGIGVAFIHILLGCAFLFGLTSRPAVQPEQILKLFDISKVPPPPPPPPPKPKTHVERPKAETRSGAASPRKLKAAPTEIVAPPPMIPLIAPSPVVTAPKAGMGAGSGGRGNGIGTGSGTGSGNGDGDDDAGTPPRQTGGRLKFSDNPSGTEGVGGTVGVRYRVGIDGRVSNCSVTRSSGNAALDSTTCRLIEERFRFSPSRDAAGRKVPSTIVEDHEWVIERGETSGRGE